VTRPAALHWLTRSSLRLALGVSLLLHLAFGAWVARSVIEAPPPPVRGELWFEEAAPPPDEPAPAPQAATSAPPAPATSTRKPVKRTERTSPSSSPDEPRADAPRAAPQADVPRAAIDLFPPDLALSPSGTVAVEPSRGETVRPDDPRFDKDVIAAKERQLVGARVKGFAEDDLAQARVERGLPPPYFSKLREAGNKGLGKLAAERGMKAPPALLSKLLGARMQDAAASYGKTGNPNLGPPGQAPRLSERLTQPDQQSMRALAQATETFDDLSRGKPLLTLTLEFRQSKSNETKTTIVKASLEPSFDAFVLEAWPRSVAAAGPPPPETFRSDELLSVWEVQGWPAPTDLDKAMTYLPAPGVMGVPLTTVIPAAIDGLRYEFRARLLRLY
jgi:hypothetical protein